LRATLHIALLLCAASCAGRAPYVWVHDLPQGQDVPTIGPGDVLDVQVYGDDKLSTKSRVLGDGTLPMPLLGSIAVAGKKPKEVATLLEGALAQYVKAPAVTVMIEESQVSVAVIGEVKTPGVIPLDSPATVLQALAKAGGLTEFADSSGIFVLRPTGDKVQRIRFEYADLINAEPSAVRFRLRAGDTLVVE
jgi:polysaccharide export outer membrane protein